ncbi:hypothetical protein MHBO_002089 [Bonamia ostreae]|uniref:Uncharacterized protein n=1 Tax=Bonamia ostreae TaxID=126728 RepID=A0ABV2AL74_9EUKA
MNLLERVVRIDESRSNINNMNDNNDESSRDGQNAKKGNLTIENKLSNLFEKIDKRENINDLNYFENTLTTGEDGKITIALLKKISENGTLGIYKENETVLQNLKIVLKTIDLDKLIKLGFLKNGFDFEENLFDLLEDLQID